MTRWLDWLEPRAGRALIEAAGRHIKAPSPSRRSVSFNGLGRPPRPFLAVRGLQNLRADCATKMARQATLTGPSQGKRPRRAPIAARANRYLSHRPSKMVERRTALRKWCNAPFVPEILIEQHPLSGRDSTSARRLWSIEYALGILGQFAPAPR
jgi:hypothetical protein